MKCTFCHSEEVQNEGLPICMDCRSAFEEGEHPQLDFNGFFSEVLEQRLKEVESLLSSYPENYFLWYLKGHLEHELGATKKALNSIKTSISYKGDYGDPWIRLGLIYSDMHRETEAIDNYRKGLMFPLLDPSNLVDAGISLQASDQPKMASLILQRELDLVPDDDRAIVALGKVYAQMSDLEEARRILEKGIRLYPHNEEVLRGMAQILLRLEDLDSAMEMYSRILDQHPRDFEALLAKGEIHLRKKELTQSLKAYQAVRDLDIHISWTGILKFILSDLRYTIELNENSPSYREDLKKEYENIVLFISDLDARTSNVQGSEPLSEIENLVKVLENLRLNLREQVRQFEALLEKFRVDDSFHQHLRTKVKTLQTYLDEHRYFDGKQISLELSPFLTDLKTRDSKADSRVKERMEQKLKELDEIGMGNQDLVIRFGMVGDLEKEGNHEGATFMLKEIEVSLEEYWIDVTRRYHEEKLEKIKGLLQEARNRFDTSTLNEMSRSFKKKIEEGPRSITEAYNEFIARYREDSSYYYHRESERLLREADLKIQIMNKDGANIGDLQKECMKLMDEMESSTDKQELFSMSTDILKRVEYFEAQQQISKTRFRLRNLDSLLGDFDFLGLDEELARNVEPVRKVIERSLKQEDYRLSEILTNELYDNMETIIRENYSSDLEEILQSTEEEIFRLRILGLEKKEWIRSVERSRDIIEGTEKGSMTEIIEHLAKVQMGLQQFMVDRLPSEIESNLKICRDMLDRGSGYGFPLSGEKRQLENLEKTSLDILSLDMLEETCKFEHELSNKLSDLLVNAISELREKIRIGLRELNSLGVGQHSIMDVLSMMNRSEVLLNSEERHEAWQQMTGALDLLVDLREKKLTKLRDVKMSQIEELLVIVDQLAIDVSEASSEYQEIIGKKDQDPGSDLQRASSIHSTLMDAIREGAGKMFDSIREGYDELLENCPGLLPHGMQTEMTEQLKRTEAVLSSGDVVLLPPLMEETRRLMDAVILETTRRSNLKQCSDIVEDGMSMNDPGAKELVRRAQDLSERIRSGETDGVGDVISGLQREMDSIRSLIHMQNIENVLVEVQHLDELAREVLGPIKDEGYSKRNMEIKRRISKLMDGTSALYRNTDPIYVDEISYKITTLNNDIIELEQEWRAHKRLEILKEMDLTEETVSDKLLSEDIVNLKQHFSSRDWNRFFRTWERLEGHIQNMERKGILPGGSMRMIEEAPASPGLDILSRKRVAPQTAGRSTASIKRSKEDGITKLAKDMAKKKQMIEDPGRMEAPRMEALCQPEEKRPLKKTGDTGKLSDMARSIAGTRIEKLRESGSKALEDVDPTLEIATQDMVEDMREIDTSMERKEVIDSEQVREKLLAFFEKFPLLLQLDEVRSHFKRGDALVQRGDMDGALNEYRVSMSTAIKVGKVHMEMGKKMATVRSTLDGLRDRGYEDQEAERLYHQAVILFKEGDLIGCARSIKSIRDALARNT